MDNKLLILKDKILNKEGIHCVIGNRYCSYNEDGYEDEFYIYSNGLNDIEIYYNKETYKYTNFNDMINDNIFNNKSINDLIDKVYFEVKNNEK